ncbi:MAG: HIT family protein [bacterium]|nr:HIT family protein [bacterium]
MNCPFCDPRVVESQLLTENENIRVLQNIRPANRGQCVIVPKRHVATIRELTKDELISLITSVQSVSQILTTYLKPIGINYGFNEGQYAGQMVEHFHFHLMPRIEGDKSTLPEYHLFHRDPSIKRDLSPEELKPLVDEMRDVFSKNRPETSPEPHAGASRIVGDEEGVGSESKKDHHASVGDETS